MTNEKNPKQKLGFTIIKNDPTDGHGGFGIGSLTLENVSPVIIDIEEGKATAEELTLNSSATRLLKTPEPQKRRARP